MGDKRSLYLYRRNPLSTYLQHIVGATAIPEVSAGIFVILVACMNPVAIDNILGLLVLVPIICSCAVSAYQQIANIALLYRVTTFVGNQCLVARHKLAGTTWLYLACAITDKNVQYFRATDAIEDLNIEFILPTPQNIRGQSFASRDTNTNGREIEVFLCFW